MRMKSKLGPGGHTVFWGFEWMSSKLQMTQKNILGIFSCQYLMAFWQEKVLLCIWKIEMSKTPCSWRWVEDWRAIYSVLSQGPLKQS